MYEELVQALRSCVLGNPCELCPYYSPTGPTEKCSTMNVAAADAIEKLSMKLHGDEAAIAGMKREIERMVVAGKPRWIPVTERLPENGTRCLVTRFDFVTNTPFIDLLWFDNSWWDRLNSGEYAVTHWMPLPPAPEPPKEEV